jgi:hypothetical protein
MNSILYQDDKIVVRGYWTDDKKEYRVTVHQVIDGKEYLPRGYMLGSNALDYRVREKKKE